MTFNGEVVADCAEGSRHDPLAESEMSRTTGIVVTTLGCWIPLLGINTKFNSSTGGVCTKVPGHMLNTGPWVPVLIPPAKEDCRCSP